MQHSITSWKEGSVAALDILQQYDATEFTDAHFKACNITVPDDFTGQRIKNGEYKMCEFVGNSFKYAGASGTRFYDCKLTDCDINGANLQYCDFSRSQIIFSKHTDSSDVKMIQASNFNQSCFYNTTFDNACINNTSISQSQFFSAKIHASDFQHSTLQDNIFCDTEITNSSFIGCNMEYSEFINVSIQDSILPFHQIPYIFGGLQCLLDSKNHIKIRSAADDAIILSANEYMEILPVFADYYLKMGEYFPLVNICLYNNKMEEALDYIYIGLQTYINSKEFRKLKALCKLAVQNQAYSRHELVSLYFKIADYCTRIPMEPSERYQYELHIDDIKNILIDNHTDRSNILIAIKTNITYHDNELIGLMINTIDECLHHCHILEEAYNLEIKHNSAPLSFWVSVGCLDPNLLVMFLGTINTIFTGNVDILMNALQVCASAATIMTFISTLKNNQHMITDHSVENHPAVSYARKKHKILQDKNIKVEISYGNLHFNYEKSEKNHLNN